MTKTKGVLIEYFKSRPMLLLALIGSMMCIIGFFSRTLAFLWGLFLLILIFVMCILRHSFVKIFSAVILFILTISILITTNRITKINEYSGNTITGEFIITDTPFNHGEFYTATFETKNCRDFPTDTKISVYLRQSGFGLGDRVQAKIELIEIDSKYKNNYYSNKVYISGYAEEISKDGTKGDFVLVKIGEWRRYITDTLFKNLDYDEACTAVALITGQKAYLSSNFNGMIKASGVSHVMVVSGMHLAIIVNFITNLTGKLFFNRYFKAFIVFLTVLFMAALCGFTPSILRAGVCFLLFAISIILKRSNTSENTLGVAVIILLINSPFIIYNVAFLLSVLSTLGIVAAALPAIDYIKKNLKPKKKLIINLFSAVLITLFANLFTMPLTIYIFGYISSVSVITNLLITFAVDIILVTGTLALFVNGISPIAAKPIFTICNLFLKYINWVIVYFGSLPFAVIYTGDFSFVISVVILTGIIVILFACKKRNDMLKLKSINDKIIREGGKRLKWQ